jgi:prepilin-type N-terminal cleavage/methylation domain
MPINKKYRNKYPQKGEAGFTLMEMVMVIVIASILGIFVFGVLTKCLVAQRDMQVKKERSDDAIRTMDKVNRELREASTIYAATNNVLYFFKSNSASSDPNPYVAYLRNTGTNTLTRQSKLTMGSSWDPANVIATDITRFDVGVGMAGRYTIQVEFAGGSDWVTWLMPRN